MTIFDYCPKCGLPPKSDHDKGDHLVVIGVCGHRWIVDKEEAKK